jgi:hypothetical protein
MVKRIQNDDDEIVLISPDFLSIEFLDYTGFFNALVVMEDPISASLKKLIESEIPNTSRGKKEQTKKEKDGKETSLHFEKRSQPFIVGVLNLLLTKKKLCTSVLTHMRTRTSDLIKQGDLKSKMARCNRFYLEDAYPEMIIKLPYQDTLPRSEFRDIAMQAFSQLSEEAQEKLMLYEDTKEAMEEIFISDVSSYEESRNNNNSVSQRRPVKEIEQWVLFIRNEIKERYFQEGDN